MSGLASGATRGCPLLSHARTWLPPPSCLILSGLNSTHAATAESRSNVRLPSLAVLAPTLRSFLLPPRAFPARRGALFGPRARGCTCALGALGFSPALHFLTGPCGGDAGAGPACLLRSWTAVDASGQRQRRAAASGRRPLSPHGCRQRVPSSECQPQARGTSALLGGYRRAHGTSVPAGTLEPSVQHEAREPSRGNPPLGSLCCRPDQEHALLARTS